MRRYRPLPLGVDIGCTRARIAFAESDRDGDVRVVAVVARDLPDGAASSAEIEQPELVAAVLEEMIAELDTKERRCVTSIGAPHAHLRAVKFPTMSWNERTNAGRFEAQRFTSWDLEKDAVVRVHPMNRTEHLYAVGAALQRTVASRTATFKHARLRLVAIDDDTFALLRALPAYDAVIDIGSYRAVVHTMSESGPRAWSSSSGGANVTNAISRELSIDENSAERRKRILGTVGAGDVARTELVNGVRELIERAKARAPVSRVALCGNAARLPGLMQSLEAASGTICEMPVSETLQRGPYPDDVLRAAAPDWTLAVGLATWGLLN